MRSKSVIIRILSCVLCVCVMFAAISALGRSSVLTADALTTSQMQDQIADYEQQAKELQNKIDSLQSDKSDARALVNALNEKISNMQKQIDLVNTEINALNKQISDAETQIAEKEAEIEKQKELLKDRLRAMYVAGANSELGVLLSADDFAEYLANAELMRKVAEHDTALMDQLNADIAEINKLLEEVNLAKADADEMKKSLVQKQNELDDDYAAAKAAYGSIVSTENSLEAEAAEIIAAKEQMEKEWKEAILAAQNNSNVILSSMNFAWPFQSSYYFSCGYGQQSYRFHTGVDITCSGAYGKPIYAIADGVVIKAVQQYTSYGFHIIIDHGTYGGNSYASLYGHCSQLLVSNGQSVKKGQLIGYVGSTGNSTGPHLHFEIRVNGDDVNPLQFYSNY